MFDGQVSKNISQFRNFGKNSHKGHVSSKDAEKEANEKVEKELELVSETSEKTELQEYDRRTLFGVLPCCNCC